MVLLKRLPDALRDGDRILAVVRGTAANQDGRTVNIATPSVDAQVAVYRAALAAAGVDAGTVGMVEAHGTGTPVGDPIEYASLAQVYGTDGPCALGSAKTNFGHTESAAGALGLIKAVLPLQHGVVPPILHFTRLPDDLAQIETGLFVPQEITPWPDERPAAATGGGVVVRNVGNQRARDRRAGSRDRCTARRRAAGIRDRRPAAVPAVVHLGRRTAPRPRGRLADWVEAHASGPWRCRIWPTPWLAGVGTGRCARP